MKVSTSIIRIILSSAILLMTLGALTAQQNCNTFLGSVGDADNNCAPCVNGMEALLKPILTQHNTGVYMAAMNRVLNQRLDQMQSTIDFLMASQDHTDRVLQEWGIGDLNGGPPLTQTQYLQNSIDEMREYSKRYPGQAEWLGQWIQNFENLMDLLKEEEDFKKRGEDLAKKIADGYYGQLENLEFDCCPEAREQGKYQDNQVRNLEDLFQDLEAFADDYEGYRSRLLDEADSLTEQLKAMLRKRAKQELDATQTRDQYANGLSGFLFAKLKEAFSSGMENLVQQMIGFEMNPEIKAALAAYNRNVEPLLKAVEKAGTNFSMGGGGGGIAGEVAQMIAEEAWDGLSPNDQAALGQISNMAFSQLASTVLQKTFEQSIKSKVAQYFLLGMESNAATLVSLLDKMLTIPAYLWEDKNLMILQGSFDRILLGLLKGIRLTQSTAQFLPSGPFDAYLDGVKGPYNRAIDICLPEQSFSYPIHENMRKAFFKAAFPGQPIQALSDNDRSEIKKNGNDTYLEYHYSNKVRFKVRFGCYCGVWRDQPAETTPNRPASTTIPGLSEIDLTGWQNKPGYGRTVRERSFPWIPVAGGLTGGGIITYFLTRDGNGGNVDSLPELVTRDDDIIVPCDGSGSIDVFTNDTGEGLVITSITPVTVATINSDQNNGLISISNVTIAADFSFDISISDQHGQTATSTLNVQVTVPTVAASSDSYEVPFGETLTGNVLANDQGPDLAVTDHSLPAEGIANIAPDGTLSFVPAEGYQGTITLTYTVAGPCNQSAETSITIVVLPPDCEYDANFTTTDATCILSDGSVSTMVEPTGDYTFQWSEGSTSANLDMIQAGAYQLTITTADGHCEKTFEVIVSEQTPPLTVDDDAYETTVGAPTTGNVLENDEGLGIMLENISNVIGGVVDFSEDGSFTFTPANGFSGEASFNYQVVDDCGNTASGQVTVLVTPVACNFTVEFLAQPASCGLENGSLEVVVNEPGNYDFVWDNGISGPINSPIGAGEHTVTVSDLDLGCSITFTTTLTGTNALTIELESIVPPSSPSANDGAINVVITSANNGPYTIKLNGDDWGVATGEVFTIEGLGAGEYTVQIMDPNGCLSNILEVDIPFEPNFGIGVSGTFMQTNSYDVELPGQDGKTIYTSVTYFTSQFRTGNTNQEIRVGLINGLHLPGNGLVIPTTVRIEQLSNIFQWQESGISLIGQAGFLGDFNRLNSKVQWQAQGKANWRLNRAISLNVKAGIRGWEKVDQPFVEFGFITN